MRYILWSTAGAAGRTADAGRLTRRGGIDASSPQDGVQRALWAYPDTYHAGDLVLVREQHAGGYDKMWLFHLTREPVPKLNVVPVGQGGAWPHWSE